MRGRARMPFHNNGGRGVPGGRGPPPHGRWRGQPQPQRPNSQQTITHPQQEQGNAKTYTDSQCWPQEELCHAKRQGAVTGRECKNSPIIPRHSPTISKSTNIGGKKMARSPIDNNKSTKFLNPDPWARLIGRANEEKNLSEWQYSDSFAGHWKPSDTYKP